MNILNFLELKEKAWQLVMETSLFKLKTIGRRVIQAFFDLLFLFDHISIGKKSALSIMRHSI